MRSDIARRITETYGLRDTDRRRLLTLFGEPQPLYSIEDAATLSCTTQWDVRHHIRETIMITWRNVWT
jgi:hypothetical protein